MPDTGELGAIDATLQADIVGILEVYQTTSGNDPLGLLAAVNAGAGTVPSLPGVDYNITVSASSAQWYASVTPQPPAPPPSNPLGTVLSVVDALGKFLPEGSDIIDGATSLLSIATGADAGSSAADALNSQLSSMESEIISQVTSAVDSATLKAAVQTQLDTVNSVNLALNSQYLKLDARALNEASLEFHSKFLQPNISDLQAAAAALNSGDPSTGASNPNYAMPSTYTQLAVPSNFDIYAASAWASVASTYVALNQIGILAEVTAKFCNTAAKKNSATCSISAAQYQTVLTQLITEGYSANPSQQAKNTVQYVNNLTSYLTTFTDTAQALQNAVYTAFAKRIEMIGQQTVNYPANTSSKIALCPSNLQCTGYFVTDGGLTGDTTFTNLSNFTPLAMEIGYAFSNAFTSWSADGLGTADVSTPYFSPTDAPLISGADPTVAMVINYTPTVALSGELAQLLALQNGRAWLVRTLAKYAQAWNYRIIIGDNQTSGLGPLIESWKSTLSTICAALPKLQKAQNGNPNCAS